MAGEADLPVELLSLILSKLEDVRERAKAARVSKRWHAAVVSAPHSTYAAVTVLADSEDEDPLPALCEYLKVCGDDWDDATASRRREEAQLLCCTALSVRQAVVAMSGPLCRGLRRLRLSPIYRSFDSFDEHSQSGCRLLQSVLAALPPTLERLELAMPPEVGTFVPVAALCVCLDLAKHVPGLRELQLLPAAAAEFPVGPETPRLPRLEVLEGRLTVLASAPDEAAAMLEALPALRRVDKLSLRTPSALFAPLGFVAPGGILALAASGLACRELAVNNSGDGSLDLRPDAVAAAIAALHRPPLFGPGARGALTFADCLLPDRWPEGAFAGAESVLLFQVPLRPATLDWLHLGAHVPTATLIALEWCPLEGATGPELLHALLRAALAAPAACGLALRVVPADGWPEAELAAFLEAAAAAGPPLLRRLEVAQTEPAFDEEAPAGAAFARYQRAREALQEADPEAGGQPPSSPSAGDA